MGIELSRVIAAFMIVCMHSMIAYEENGGQTVLGIQPYRFVGGIFLWGRVPFFMILSGYFAARSLTKPGMSNRRFLQTRLIGLGVPYLVWNSLALAMQGFGDFLRVTHDDATAHHLKYYVSGIFGIGAIPADYPMWFVRDIIVVSCLAPLLLKFRLWLFVPAMALISFPAASMMGAEFGIPRPSSCGYFALGMLIQLLDVRRLGALFASPAQGWILCMGLGCLSVFVKGVDLGAIGPLLGALSIVLLGEAIAGGCPRLANLLSSASPSTFLLFAAHMPLINAIMVLVIKYGDMGNSQKLVFYCLLPIFLTVLLVIAHNQIRRFFPKLLFPLTGGR